jgi:hypothetical protein
VAAGLAAAPPAAAAPLRARLEVGGGLSRLDYVEVDAAGAFIDGEEGWLPSLSAEAELGRDRWYVAARGGAAFGEVAYEGRVESSSPALDGLPARTTTETALLRAEAAAGVRVGPRRRVALEAGVGWRSWDRDIRATTVVSRTGAVVPVSGLFEEYAWYEVRGGARWTFLATDRAECDLELGLLHTVAPTLALDWFGQPVALELGPRGGWRAGLAARVALGPGAYATLRAAVEDLGHGASAPDARTGVHEPESTTRTVAVQAGVGFRR